MATDDYCKNNEKSSIFFLFFAGLIFLTFGIFTFETSQITNTSLKDWVLLGYIPIVLIYLSTKSKLLKLQFEITGKKPSFFELNIKTVQKPEMVKRYKVINKINWGYAVLMLTVFIWSEFEKSI